MAEVSVIVPVYRAENYIHDCIGSILSQTFSDFELLLVDDGSPDNCLAICREYAEKDPRITVFHQENQGQAAARNHALKYAKGQWLCFVDSDDSIHLQMVELLYRAAQESGCAIAQCRMLEAVERPDDFARLRSGSFQTYDMDENTLAELFDRGEYPAWVSCAKLIKRELVESYPFTPGRVYEDNEAVCRWVIQAGKLADIEEELYFYRGNPDSTTQKAFSRKRLDYLWALESILRFYGQVGYSAMQRRFCGLYANTAADYYRHCLAHGWPEEAEKIRKTAKTIFYKYLIPMSKRQVEILQDAIHPTLIRCYWPLEAALRRLGIVKKGE